MTTIISQAVKVLNQGGVIAYPTEYCFGLGCDPLNQDAVSRVLKIKGRSSDQGLLLIAADLTQVFQYADLNISPIQDQIVLSWPGPVTWTLPARDSAPKWLTGKHSSIAMRITAHQSSVKVCQEFGQAIVSTSANRHSQPALLTAQDVEMEMGSEIDFILRSNVGNAQQASTIRDGMTGATLR